MHRRLMIQTVAAAGGALAGRGQAQVGAVPGEVMKLDRPAGRVTLRHGEIQSLSVPPMTLVWRVTAPHLLDDIAVGDRVRFVPARIDGQYTITALTKGPP